MSTSEKTDEVQQLLAALKAQAATIDKLSKTVEDQSKRLDALSVGKLPGAQIPVGVSLRGGTFDDADTYYVRLKPYNPRYGYLRMRTLVPEIGKVMNGGTGEFGNVPEWVEVTKKVAKKVAIYRQDDNNPGSPALFDIVTAEEREAIDRVENTQRMAGLGLAGATPAEALAMANQVAARVRQAATPKSVEPDARPAPALLEGSAQYRMPETDIRPSAPPPPPSSPPAMGASNVLPVLEPPPAPELSPDTDLGGRAAALEGLEPRPEDLTNAARHASDSALLGAAAQFVDTKATGGSSRRGPGRR